LVVQFCSLANCEPSEAEHYLQAAAYDINTAMSLYLENAAPRQSPAVRSEPVSIRAPDRPIMDTLVQDDVYDVQAGSFSDHASPPFHTECNGNSVF
jgi:hypothetical protein